MRKNHLLLLGVGALITALAVWGFIEGRKELAREQERELPVAVPQRVAAFGGGTEVVFDAEAQKLADIGVAALARSTRRTEVDALATVLSPQALIELRNRYVAAAAQADKAAAALAASRREYERVKQLHGDDRNVSDRALQAAEAAWRSDAADAQAAQAARDAIGKGGRPVWGEALTAAVAGNTAIFQQLASQKAVLLRVAAPAGTRLHEAPATASVIGDDGVARPAELLSPAPQTDPRIQGPTFFYTAPADGLLPGSILTARLPVGSAESGATVPATAVLSWQGQSWFYVERTPGHFVRRALRDAVPVEQGWFMPGLSSLQVVVRGAQSLLSEELRGQIKVGEGD